jgi:hypothetical protein
VRIDGAAVRAQWTAVADELLAAHVEEPAWLSEVRLRSRLRAVWLRAWWATGEQDDRGLAIGHSEVDRALADPAEAKAREREFRATDSEARRLAAEVDALATAADPAWERLVERLGLSVPESNLLALAVAAQARPALRRVFGYLHDDVQPADASPELAAALWDWPRGTAVGPGCALSRWGLARPVPTAGASPWSPACRWQADPTLLNTLMPRAGAPDPTTTPRLVLYPDIACEITTFITAFFPDPADAPRAPSTGIASTPRTPSIEIELTAPPGTGRATLAAQAAAALGRSLVTLDTAVEAPAGDPEAATTAATRACREAVLRDAALLWRDADAADPATRAAVRSLVPLVFLTTATRLAPSADAQAVRRSFDLPPLSRSRRLMLWPAAGGLGAPPAPVTQWPLRAAEVQALARVSPAGPAAVREVALRLLTPPEHDLLTPMPLPFTWDDLVLPRSVAQHLRELAEQARDRGEVLDDWGFGTLTPAGRGLTVLFAGPSGTGKTMAAQVLARALGLGLYRVDLAAVVDKYVGETEKRLRAVFEACERVPAVLFFDEADALFGRRSQVSDAHDRFANIQVDYLMQRMESFDGLAVLASNRRGDLDEAFTRRLRAVVEFVHPAPAERERLWRHSLPAQAHVGPLDYGALARELDLTGAGISSTALAAVFLARAENTVVGMRHVVAAARRELAKNGAVLRPGALDSALAPAQGAAGGQRTP